MAVEDSGPVMDKVLPILTGAPAVLAQAETDH
jgi:hypothetical protein